MGDGGRTTSGEQEGSTTISAVVALGYVCPNSRILEDALRKQHEEDVRAGLTREESLGRTWELAQEIERKYEAEFIGRKESRLRVYHNPHAAIRFRLMHFQIRQINTSRLTGRQTPSDPWKTIVELDEGPGPASLRGFRFVPSCNSWPGRLPRAWRWPGHGPGRG